MDNQELKPCPFCGENVVENQDDCGGSWIEHKERHKMGSMQKCILTDIQINTSSRTHAEWNTRPTQPKAAVIDREALAKNIFNLQRNKYPDTCHTLRINGEMNEIVSLGNKEIADHLISTQSSWLNTLEVTTVEEIKDAIDDGFDTYDGCEQIGRDVVKHHIAKAIVKHLKEGK